MEGGIFRTLVFAYPPLGFFLPDGLGEDLGEWAERAVGPELGERFTER